MNAGIGSAYIVAELTSNILSSPSPKEMLKGIQTYQIYSHDFMLPLLHQMNRYWYNMFCDHRLFEVLIVCYCALAIGDIEMQYDDMFDDEDSRWLVGGGGDEFQEFFRAVLGVVGPILGIHFSKLVRKP
jgi:hypothetical protein